MAVQVEVPSSSRAGFGSRPFIGSHGLPGHELFTDEALVELLDSHPREFLFALSMGTDPTRAEDNRLADLSGVRGAELLRAVQHGRLWLNVTRVNQAHRRYRDLVDELYRSLRGQIAGFAPEHAQGTLLISSPNALVYYHVDGPPSVLWHIRGRKRLWVYPALDERFVARDVVEDIFAGVRHEYVPYRTEFDQQAVRFDLEPGQVAFWPQNAPHRVTNLDSLNVSLATEHFTPESRRRARVYLANRFLRLRLGLGPLSVRPDGVAALAKAAVHRAARTVGLDPVTVKSRRPTLRIAPDAPLGVVELSAAGSRGSP
jgi:hypothetical protein